jgi:type II secretory pathway pseudopilin PulG
MRARTRPAFSLFELLIVIALIGFLLALLFPAVLKTRAAAARAQSTNNLKQMALACHSYHDTNGTLPPGNDDNHFSASAKLLPYIEQNNVYQIIKFDKPLEDKDNDQARQLQIKVFLSPQDPLPTVKPNLGATNYLFNAGSQYALKDNDGVFFQDSKIGLTAIADGTSNTLMIGETLKGDGGTKAVTVERQYVRLTEKNALKDLKDDSGVEDFKDNKHIAGDRCASWMDGRFLQGTFTATREMNDERPDVSCDGLGGLSALRSTSGGVVNVAVCDGSVRSLTKTINLKVWKALSTRAGGEVASFDQ